MQNIILRKLYFCCTCRWEKDQNAKRMLAVEETHNIKIITQNDNG